MAGTERSNIEVFFRVLGASTVTREFDKLEKAGLRTTRAIARAGASTTTSFGRQSVSAVSSLIRSIGGIAPGIGLGVSAARTLFDVLKKTAVQATIASAAIYGIGKGFATFSDANAELTSTVLALRAINLEITKASGMPKFAADGLGFGLVDTMSGSARKTASDLAYLNKVAYDHGQTVKSIAKDYVQLTASTSKSNITSAETRRVFKGVSDAALVLGRSSDDVHRANVALQQIASKGQVYQEELRQQLSEALPGILPLVAEAYDVTQKELNKMIAAGQLSSDDFFRKFGAALDKNYGQAAKAAANTTRVAAGQLANAWFNAKVAIGSGDFDKQISRILKAVTKLLSTLTKTGAFMRFGKDLAKGMEPLISRFEAAVRGGYNFERVLNGLAFVFRKTVDGVMVTIDVFGTLSRSLSNLIKVYRSYGIVIPKVGTLISGAATTIERFTKALDVREFTGNGYIDFFVALYSLVEAVAYAILKIASPKVGPGLLTMEGIFSRMAYWINQVGIAIVSLASGQIMPNMDANGASILVWLIQAVQKVKELQAGIKTTWQLLSGEGAPEGASIDQQKMFAKRDALSNLVTGGDNKSQKGKGGVLLYDERTFKTLFRIRDIVTSIVDFIYDNRGAFAGFFDGAIDVVKGFTAFLDTTLKPVLQTISDILGFDNLNYALGYALGFYFVATRISGAFGLVKSLIGGVSVAFTAINSAAALFAGYFGITAFELIAIVATLGVVAYTIDKISHNWRLFTDNLLPAFYSFGAWIVDVFASIFRGISVLLRKIPGIGNALASATDAAAGGLESFADKGRTFAQQDYDAAVAQRKKENGGKDPYENGPVDGGIEKAIKSGFDSIRSTLFGSPTDVMKQIADMNAQGPAAATEGAEIGRQVKEALVGVNDNKPDREFVRPVTIVLPNGQQAEARVRNSDPAIDALVAEAARTRGGQSPAWNG